MFIKINIDSISKDEDDIFGEIYFSKDSFVFPDKNWNDYLIIIINWWMEELTKFTKNEKTSAELVFMDGPLSVKINHFDNDSLKFFFVQNDKVIDSKNVLSNDFFKNFLFEINSLILYLKQREWQNKEIKKLTKNYSSLFKTLKENSQ